MGHNGYGYGAQWTSPLLNRYFYFAVSTCDVIQLYHFWPHPTRLADL